MVKIRNMEQESEISSDKMQQEVWQHSLVIRIRLTRFRELEELIGKAAQNMENLHKKIHRRRKSRLNNPSAKAD